jgi:hypothetical protein
MHKRPTVAASSPLTSNSVQSARSSSTGDYPVHLLNLFSKQDALFYVAWTDDSPLPHTAPTIFHYVSRYSWQSQQQQSITHAISRSIRWLVPFSLNICAWSTNSPILHSYHSVDTPISSANWWWDDHASLCKTKTHDLSHWCWPFQQKAEYFWYVTKHGVHYGMTLFLIRFSNLPLFHLFLCLPTWHATCQTGTPYFRGASDGILAPAVVVPSTPQNTTGSGYIYTLVSNNHNLTLVAFSPLQ